MPSQHGNLEQKYTWKTHLGLVTSLGGTRFTNSRNHFMGSNNLHQQENSRVPLEVSCLHFIWVIRWKRFHLRHPNDKLKKKTNPGWNWVPIFFLLFSYFLLFFLSFPYPSPTHLHIFVFFGWSVYFSSSPGTCVFLSSPYMIRAFRLFSED